MRYPKFIYTMRSYLALKCGLATLSDWQDLESRVYRLERYLNLPDGAYSVVLCDIEDEGAEP